MNVACGPERHQHPPMRRECQGCHRRNCGPDDYVATTAGRWWVCEGCYEKHRAGWLNSRGRA